MVVGRITKRVTLALRQTAKPLVPDFIEDAIDLSFNRRSRPHGGTSSWLCVASEEIEEAIEHLRMLRCPPTRKRAAEMGGLTASVVSLLKKRVHRDADQKHGE